MTRDEALAILIAHRGELEARGVAHAALFGSTARNEAGPDSDVDILVDLAPDANVGVWEFVALQRKVGEFFPVKTDVVERDSLDADVERAARVDLARAF